MSRTTAPISFLVPFLRSKYLDLPLGARPLRRLQFQFRAALLIQYVYIPKIEKIPASFLGMTDDIFIEATITCNAWRAIILQYAIFLFSVTTRTFLPYSYEATIQ